MTVKELEQAVSSGTIQNLYLLYGPDEWQKKRALQCLRSAVLPAGLEDLNDITLENPSVQEIIEASDLFPVMSDKRIVCVRNPAFLTAKKNDTDTPETGDPSGKKPEDAKPEKGDSAKLFGYLSNVPETTVLLFILGPDAKPAINAQKKLESLKCGFIVADHLQGKELLNWCNVQLKPFKKKIAPDAVDEMVLMAGVDLVNLETELRKLASFIGDAPIIDISAVRACVSPSIEYISYLLLDSILEADFEKASLTAQAVLTGSTTPVGLINMLASQLRYDIHINYGKAENVPDQVIGKALGFKGKTPEKRVWGIHRQSRKYPTELLVKAYLMCVQANYDATCGQKRGDAVLDALLPALCKLFKKR